MNKLSIYTLACAALLTVGTAHAGGGQLFGGTGDDLSLEGGAFYGGASYGLSNAYCAYTDDDCENDGWKVFGGYRINEMFSVEGGYYNLVDIDEEHVGYDLNKDGYDNQLGLRDVKASGVALTGVASYPLADNLEVFGKAGIMKWEAESTIDSIDGYDATSTVEDKKNLTQEVDGTDVLLGVGASYQFTDNLGIRGEYEYVGGDLEANIYSIGATFSSM